MSTKILKVFLIILIVINLTFSQDDIIFSQDSGFYGSEFLLTLSTSSELESLKIYYTTDGTNPSNSNTTKIYTEPIQIKDRSNEPNIYSNYEEDMDSPLSISINYGYKKPDYLIEKAMVVRAVIKNGKNFGKIMSRIYFIISGDLAQFKKYTIVSLVINPEDLFDPEKGIYVTGNQFIEYKKSEKYNPEIDWDPDLECNFYMKGSDWEREASMTIFENGKISIEQNVGVRIKGATSRDLPQKSFNIFARKKYGNKKIKSSTLFPNNKDINGNPINEYNSISLRSIPNEERSRDFFVNKIIHETKNQATLDMKESILFLNGELWGMYTITEKFSKDFFESHYNIPKEDIIFTKEGKMDEDTTKEITDLYNFMDLYSKKDLSNENNYKEVCNFIDIDSLIEHYATGIYIVMIDWPNNNYRMWKSNKTGDNFYYDGKWRFMGYDFDYTMGNTYDDFGDVECYEYNMFNRVERSKRKPPTNLFIALLKNEEFKNKFMKSYEEFINNIMPMDKINSIIEKFKEEIAYLIAYSYKRWSGYLGSSKKETFKDAFVNYNKILKNLNIFFEKRPKYTLENMKNYLSQLE